MNRMIYIARKLTAKIRLKEKTIEAEREYSADMFDSKFSDWFARSEYADGRRVYCGEYLRENHDETIRIYPLEMFDRSIKEEWNKRLEKADDAAREEMKRLKKSFERGIDVHVAFYDLDFDKERKLSYPSGYVTPGMGDSRRDEEPPVIAIYGGFSYDDNCKKKQWFRKTFVHEMMHLLDKLFGRAFDDGTLYGHPAEKDKDGNDVVPWCGMDNEENHPDDDWAPVYAESLTSRNERREYVNDIAGAIEELAKKRKISEKQVISYIRKSLYSVNDFRKMVNMFYREGIGASPFDLLYHLCFSKQKNGDRKTALEILKNMEADE